MRESLKKLIAAVLTAAMAMSISMPAFATESFQKQSDWRTEEARQSLEHDEFLAAVEKGKFDIQKTNEFAALTKTRNLSKEDLEYKNALLAETKNRAALSKDELKKMGYSDEKIAKLKALENVENITVEQASDTAPDVVVYSMISAHSYNSFRNETYFILEYDWVWEATPLYRGTDILGIAWSNDDWYLYSEIYPNSNINYVRNYTLSGSLSSTDRTQWFEQEIATASITFPVAKTANTFAKSGYGAIELKQPGRILNPQFSFKYGHGRPNVTPQLSIPQLAINFGFSGVTDTYAAPLLSSGHPDNA